MRNRTPALIVTDVHTPAVVYALANSAFTRLDGRWATGVLLTLLFTGIARWLRGVTTTGAAAGALCCFVLYLGGGSGAFAALITVFGLAWFTTRLGYQHKQKLGVAEKREGRNASQVLANLGVATACAALFLLNPGKPAFLLALAAALSEAAADTVSSEVGQAFADKARLITNWESVPAGTNGAVSLIGTLSGIVAAGIVSSVCTLDGLLPRSWLAISVGAAVLGMLADSFLGAWLERRRLLNNDSVNFISTLVAAIAAYAVG